MDTVRSFYERYIYEGLILSIIIHVVFFGTYYFISAWSDNDPEIVLKPDWIRYTQLGPPPSIMATDVRIAVGASILKPQVGIPVPVPNFQVDPNQTIASQTDMGAVWQPTDGGTEGGGTTVVNDLPKIPDTDPNPDTFFVVEKDPVPVQQAWPLYPEIARRAGIEGTVWVKILVGTDGRAKKAIVIKSDNEIFNENAIEAALHWLFTPAMMNNGPVKVWAAVPFRFKLK